MKVLVLLIVMLFAGFCFAEVPAISQTEISVYFSSYFHDEDSKISPAAIGIAAASLGSESPIKTTLKELYKQGWVIKSVTKTNASAQNYEMLFFMERKGN